MFSFHPPSPRRATFNPQDPLILAAQAQQLQGGAPAGNQLDLTGGFDIPAPGIDSQIFGAPGGNATGNPIFGGGNGSVPRTEQGGLGGFFSRLTAQPGTPVLAAINRGLFGAESFKMARQQQEGLALRERELEDAQLANLRARTAALTGTEADVPSGAVKLVRKSDGSTEQVRLDDPRLDTLLNAGGRVIDAKSTSFKDPLTGETFLFNPSTDQTRRLSAGSGGATDAAQNVAQQDAPAAQKITPFDIDVIGEAVGPVDAAKRFISRTPILGQIFSGVGIDQQKASRSLKSIDNKLRKALTVNSSRVSNFDLQLVDKLLPSTGAFSTEEAAQAGLQELQRGIVEQIELNRRDASDGSLAPKIRSDAQRAFLDLEDVSADISGVLAARTFATTRIGGQSLADMDNAAIEALDPSNLTDEQIQAIILFREVRRDR